MDDLIKILNKYFRYIKLQDVLLSIVELILSTLVGGLLGVWLSTPNVNTWIIIGFFVAIIILIALILNRLIKQVHFPYEAISFLENREQLTRAINDLNRKEIIYEYIDDTIKMLNVNTCSITNVHDQENFCQTPLAEGLQTLLSPLILQTHYILNCNKSHFTIAAYIEGCPVENIKIDNSTNPPAQTKFISYESKTFCFKDDFNLSEYFV